MTDDNRLLVAAAALVVTQVVHGAVPGESGEGEAWLGQKCGPST